VIRLKNKSRYRLSLSASGLQCSIAPGDEIEVSPEDWREYQAQDTIKAWLKALWLIPIKVKGKGGVTAEARALEEVETTNDLDALEQLMRGEQRPAVVEAIKARAEAIVSANAG
jgi:hypothetical protein